MVFGELCLVLQHRAGGCSCWAKGCSHIVIQRVLKPQAKQKPATDLNFARCLSLIREKEGKIKGISQWKSIQVSLHSGVEGLCVCLCFGYSPELPSAPKTKVNKLANYGWHIPLDFFFFSFLLYFPSKQELAPSPSAVLALCMTQFPHQDLLETHTALDLRQGGGCKKLLTFLFKEHPFAVCWQWAEHTCGPGNTFPIAHAVLTDSGRARLFLS